MASEIPTKSPTVVHKQMDDGGVLFCTRTEVYFGLNAVGAAVWARLPEADEKPVYLAALVEALRHLYPDVDSSRLEGDVTEFLELLEANELVSHVDATSG